MCKNHYIFTNREQNLEQIPFHQDSAFITRLAPEHFPVHTAIHCISGIKESPEKYVHPHQHDVPEINIFIPTSTDFCFEVQLGDKLYFIHEHTSLWVPPQLVHAANIKEGSGFFICIILAATENIVWR